MNRWSLAAVALLAVGAGCFGDLASPSSGPPPERSTGEGKILIRWTVAGKPASADACAGIDHLSLALVGVTAESRIEPIPCSLDRFRFDRLPEGQTSLRLRALDGKSCVLAEARALVDIGRTLPLEPSPVLALPAPGLCR